MKKLVLFLAVLGLFLGAYYLYFRIDFYVPVERQSTDLLPKKQLHVILDLNGVLINTNSKVQRDLVGTTTLIKYMLKDWYRFTINHPRTLLFNFIGSLKPQNLDEIAALDKDGKKLPQYMCDWLKGTVSGKELLTIVTDAVSASSLSTLEKTLIAKIAQATFEAEKFVLTRTVEKNGLTFLKECIAQGYKVYVITNWDADSFALLEQRFPEVFALLDGIVVSGQAGFIKPDPALYRYALKKFKLSADTCVFIDDIAHNVTAARQVGMQGIVCPQKYFLWKHTPDYSAVLQELATLERHQEW